MSRGRVTLDLTVLEAEAVVAVLSARAEYCSTQHPAPAPSTRRARARAHEKLLAAINRALEAEG